VPKEEMNKEGEDKMAKYREKSIVIEAIQFNGNNLADIHEFCGDKIREPVGKNYLEIETLEGVYIVSPGDYIIKGIQGNFYLCKPNIFEVIYEKVNDENPGTITKETSLSVIVESLVKGESSFLMKCPSCGKRTISSQQAYIYDNIKREWYCKNCGQKLNNYNLLKKEV
jgi:ribosomal protein S27E